MTIRLIAGAFAGLLLALSSIFFNPQNARAQDANATLPFSLIVNVGHRETLENIAYTPKGDIALSRDHDGAVKMWDAATARLLRTVQLGEGSAVLAISPDGRLGAGKSNEDIVLWDLASGRIQQTFRKPMATPGYFYDVSDLAFDAQGSRLLAVDGNIRIWDVRSGTLIRTLTAPNIYASSAIFLPDQRSVVSVGSSVIAFWDAETGKLLRKVSLPAGSVFRTAFSRDGAYLAVSDYDKKVVLIYEVATGKLLRRLSGFAGETAIAFSPDGHRLATGDNSLIKIWDVSSGAALQSFVASPANIFSLTFSPDGKRLVSGGSDKQVGFWDVETGHAIGAAASQTGDAFAVAESPDGNYLLSGSAGVARATGLIPRRRSRKRPSVSGAWTAAGSFVPSPAMLPGMSPSPFRETGRAS